MSARSIDRRLFLLAMTLSLVLMLVGFSIGFQTDLSSSIQNSPSAAADSVPWWAVWGKILLINLPALCLAFSGVLTAGISTLIAWPLTSIYIGTTMRTAFTELGLGEVIGAIWMYAPWEFAALFIAAGAGLFPITAAAHAALFSKEGPSPMQQYLRATPNALMIFCVAAALLVVAALIEAILITSKGIVV